MGKVAEYRATVNLPGLRAGETARFDPDSAPYLRAWIDASYLVPVSDAPQRPRRRKR